MMLSEVFLSRLAIATRAQKAVSKFRSLPYSITQLITHLILTNKLAGTCRMKLTTSDVHEVSLQISD